MERRVLWLLLVFAAWPLAGAQRKETLIYSRFEIDPGEWRYFEFPSKEKDARLQVQVDLQAPKNAPGVRVAVMNEEEFRRFRAGQPHRAIASSAYRREGNLRTRLAEPGGYAVIIDNRLEGRRKSRVEMEVTLTTGPDPENLPVDYASPQKRLIVVSVSLAGFLLILVLSGRALWRATRQ